MNTVIEFLSNKKDAVRNDKLFGKDDVNRIRFNDTY